MKKGTREKAHRVSFVFIPCDVIYPVTEKTL